jgi:hypothetical protein
MWLTSFHIFQNLFLKKAMSLYRYQTLTFLDYKSNWFLWEPSWREFRPITSFSWTGTGFFLDDRAYCSDPSDELYGYGTQKMKQICTLLTQKYEPLIASAKPVKTPSVGKSEWFYDRFVSFSPCAPKDLPSWKRLAKGRHDTLRRVVRNKLTRRVL